MLTMVSYLANCKDLINEGEQQVRCCGKGKKTLETQRFHKHPWASFINNPTSATT